MNKPILIVAGVLIPVSGTIMYFTRDSKGDVEALVSVSGGGREAVLERSKPTE